MASRLTWWATVWLCPGDTALCCNRSQVVLWRNGAQAINNVQWAFSNGVDSSTYRVLLQLEAGLDKNVQHKLVTKPQHNKRPQQDQWRILQHHCCDLHSIIIMYVVQSIGFIIWFWLSVCAALQWFPCLPMLGHFDCWGSTIQRMNYRTKTLEPTVQRTYFSDYKKLTY